VDRASARCRSGTILPDFRIDHLARTGREGSELIFGRTAHDLFTANRVQGRADDAWESANGRERGSQATTA
jgi:hypothetical protein